jgi:hypothetical protein
MNWLNSPTEVTEVKEILTLLVSARQSISDAMGRTSHQRMPSASLTFVVYQTTTLGIFELANRVDVGRGPRGMTI